MFALIFGKPPNLRFHLTAPSALQVKRISLGGLRAVKREMRDEKTHLPISLDQPDAGSL